jgi:hypothetical protein
MSFSGRVKESHVKKALGALALSCVLVIATFAWSGPETVEAHAPFGGYWYNTGYVLVWTGPWGCDYPGGKYRQWSLWVDKWYYAYDMYSGYYYHHGHEWWAVKYSWGTCA